MTAEGGSTQTTKESPKARKNEPTVLVYARPTTGKPGVDRRQRGTTNPVFANPVFANPVFANPAFANPVFANAAFAI